MHARAHTYDTHIHTYTHRYLAQLIEGGEDVLDGLLVAHLAQHLEERVRVRHRVLAKARPCVVFRV